MGHFFRYDITFASDLYLICKLSPSGSSLYIKYADRGAMLHVLFCTYLHVFTVFSYVSHAVVSMRIQHGCWTIVRRDREHITNCLKMNWGDVLVTFCNRKC